MPTGIIPHMQLDDDSTAAKRLVANIEKRLEALGLSARKASIQAGSGPDLIRDIGRGRIPAADKMHAIARVLQTTVDELMRPGAGVREDVEPYQVESDFPATREVQIAIPGYAQIAVVDVRPGMGGPAEVLDTAQETRLFPNELLTALRARPEDLRFMRVVGPSMTGMLEHDDWVLVNITQRNPSQPAIFMVWDGIGVVCKWVERVYGVQPPRIRLISNNPTFTPFELTIGADENDFAEAMILGRVVWYARAI